MSYEVELKFAKRLAKQAGETMLKYFDADQKVEIKSDDTPVTIADKTNNQMMIDEVKKHFPKDGVYGEEDSFGKNRERLWVCDPIDGTVPYTMRLPVSVFSLALVIDGKPVLGVVYDPYLDKLYEAVVGNGAFCNGNKLVVSTNNLGLMSKVNIDWWPEVDYDIAPAMYKISKETGCYILSPGSAIKGGLLVAAGYFDASIFPGTKGKNVDMAAIKVIVEEAGGRVTNLFGEDQRYDQDIKGAVISNGVVHDNFIKIFEELR